MSEHTRMYAAEFLTIETKRGDAPPRGCTAIHFFPNPQPAMNTTFFVTTEVLTYTENQPYKSFKRNIDQTQVSSGVA